MKYVCLIVALINLISCTDGQAARENDVCFTTSNRKLQEIYNRAEALALLNIDDFDGRQVLIEGARYKNVWLETQPMGGYMYAKRNPEIARNNIEIFIDNQRSDGRFPGVIYKREDGIDPNYCQFQGLYLAMPAYELYFLLGKDTSYLRRVSKSLEKFDAYLWKTRDSDNNGCLETWCIYDNGEDHSIRFNGFPNAWAFDFPPSREAVLKLSPEELKVYCKEDAYDSSIDMTVPIESMDVMSYSYSCRKVLALIAEELQNGQAAFWENKAAEVQAVMKDYLWDKDKGACYDRDKDNRIMPFLLHNNLRCMYLGSFDQEMANSFVKKHLLNPDEFWTPLPLPSIAANDPGFKNIEGNNWSGQAQGLTFQRSIRALENYNFYVESLLIGRKFLNAIGDSLTFTQQFDPFTGQTNNSQNGYGPSILATLEFISRMYGLHISKDRIHWSCLNDEFEYTYTQHWRGNEYTIKTSGDFANCYINSRCVLSFSRDCRIVTDLNGEALEMIGICPETRTIKMKLTTEKNIQIEPNAVIKFKSL